MVRRLAALALLALLLRLPAGASGPSIPPPEGFLEADSVSVAVVNARPDDAGFRGLLANAWGTLQGRDLDSMPPMLGMLLRAMGRGSEEDGLASFLPAQAVRVDGVRDGRLQPTYAVTVTGWPGLQGLFYQGMASGPDGEPRPTREVLGQTLILGDHEEVPVLARVRGTFLACPDETRAEHAVRALVRPPHSPPQTRLLYALKRIEPGRDLYGAMLNREGGLLRFLDWSTVISLERVRQEAAGEDLEELAGHIGLMAWDGDLVDDDRVALHARFETDGPEAAARLARVLLAAHQVLQDRKRVDHWQVGASAAEVDLRFTMTGFRQAVQSFVGKLGT